MNIDLDKIGNFLFEQRNKKGLTQEQLALQIGVSFKTVSKWERGGSFPDVSYQLLLCDALDISLKELHLGCLDVEERKKKKLLSLFTNISCLIILIVLPFLIFLSIFFFSHVGKPRIYQISSDASCEKIGVVQGSFIKSYKQNYLMINNIEIFDYHFDEKDSISVDLYSDKKVIYHNNVLEPFTLSIDNLDEINLNKLKLVVSTDNNSKYVINLSLSEDLKVTSIINKNAYNNDTVKYNLLPKLNELGFKNIIGEVWHKNVKDDNVDIDINIYSISNKIRYTKTTQDAVAELQYYQDYNILEAVVYSNKILNTIVEKYTYNYYNQEVDCKIGICASYKKAVADIDEYISLLNGE